MSESEAVKIKCETLAETAFGSCGDRVGLAFVHMQLALNLSEEVKNMTDQEVYDYAKQESVIKFLSDKSQAKIDQIKTTGGILDEIETHLAYLQIAPQLGLNLEANGMLYQQEYSNVTDRDLESAKEEFRELDLDLRIANHLYEDEMLQKYPLVQKIIEEVSSREEFCTNQKDGENSQEYQTRMSALKESVAEATIKEIAARLNEIKSRHESVSNPETTESAEAGSNPETPELTIAHASSSRVGGGQGCCQIS